MRNMTAKLLSCAIVALAAGSVPALAADASPFDFRASPQTVPETLTAKQKQLYTQVLAAIRGQRWAEAKALIGDDNGPLADFLRAELLTAANSPRAEVADIMPVLSRSPQLPQADQLGRLAAKRGATDIPTLPSQARLAWAGSAPRRVGADSIGDPSASGLARSIPDRIKNDDPAGAEALYSAAADKLTPEARDEWQQKIAWSYYI
jgi:soluble lytic murein transglycosylase